MFVGRWAKLSLLYRRVDHVRGTGWWNCQFNPEIDLVGADRGPIASQVFFCGPLKWLGPAFDGHDLRSLQQGRASCRAGPGWWWSAAPVQICRTATQMSAGGRRTSSPRRGDQASLIDCFRLGKKRS